MAVHFAKCCHPLPGERIVGIVQTGRGVTIHTIDCENLQNFNDQPERWLDVSWQGAPGDEAGHVARIQVTVANEPGALGAITTLIGKYDGNIANLKFVGRSADFFDMMIDIEVRDIRHLTSIVAALRTASVVSSVQRARN